MNKTLTGQKSDARITRDGKPYDLEVIVDFDGDGGFGIWVKLDGVNQMSGHYRPPVGKGYFDTDKFYFKHGSYSKNRFPYTMRSTNMRVRNVRLK